MDEAAHNMPELQVQECKTWLSSPSRPSDTFLSLNILSVLINAAILSVLRDIKHNARIPVPNSWNLVGVADETGLLKEGEVYGKLIIYYFTLRLAPNADSFQCVSGTVTILLMNDLYLYSSKVQFLYREARCFIQGMLEWWVFNEEVLRCHLCSPLMVSIIFSMLLFKPNGSRVCISLPHIGNGHRSSSIWFCLRDVANAQRHCFFM